MYPFLPEYLEQINAPICTDVTDLSLHLGVVVILGFGQGLWYGNRMETSLINPNQCQNFGIKICDNPTNPYTKIDIEAPEDLFVPIIMEG